MSIRNRLFLAISVLCLMTIAFSLYIFISSYQSSQFSSKLESINNMIGIFISSTHQLAEERELTLLALKSKNPADLTTKESLKKIRDSFKEYIEKALPQIKEVADFSERKNKINNMMTQLNWLEEKRKKIDAALDLPILQRDQFLVDAVFKEFTNFILLTQYLCKEITKYSVHFDSLYNSFKIQHLTWTIDENIAQQKSIIASFLNSQNRLTKEDISLMNSFDKLIFQMWGEIDEFMNDDYITKNLTEIYEKTKKEYFERYLPLKNKIVQSEVSEDIYTGTPDQWLKEGEHIQKEMEELIKVEEDLTTKVSLEKSHSTYKALILSAILFLVILSIAAITFWVISKKIIRPLRQLQKNIESLRDGNTSFEMTITSNDEIGQTAKALLELKQTIAKAFQLQQMVEEMPVSVLVADPQNDFKITYSNKANYTLMTKLGKIMGFNPDELIGKNIDFFHKNPKHQRSIVSDIKNLPYKAKIQIGEEWVNLQASPIVDKHGNYTAVMTTWDLITDKVRLADDFENSIKSIVDLVSQSSNELKTSTSVMAQNAEKTSYNSGIVASSSQETSINVQTVASAAEELSNSIQEIAQQVSQSSLICNKAVTQAKNTNQTIQSLVKAAHKIGEVVNLITEIAGKTNLLALNATIEAARAGEAGKGFAVVASEVKDLANQTAKATDEIAGQIASIQNSTSEAVKAIETISAVIVELNEIATSIASAVEEQGAATKEIALNVQQTSTGTHSVMENIKEVNQTATETRITAKQVLSSTEELSQQSETLQNEVDRFLKEIARS